MLRITTIDASSGATRLRLEGRLVGPWVDELRRVAKQASKPLCLDLAELHFADVDGVTLLRELLGGGAIAENTSAFVQTLLGQDQVRGGTDARLLQRSR